jgi:hypothetical protein
MVYGGTVYTDYCTRKEGGEMEWNGMAEGRSFRVERDLERI